MSSSILAIAVRGQFLTQLQNVRYLRNKHWNPKFHKERGRKTMKVDLSRYETLHDQPDEDMVRKKMQEKGLLPQKPWQEKAIYIGSTGGIFESYVPPEGDGKFSIVTKQGAQQNVDYIVKKSKSYKAVKKIQSYDEDFNVKDFPNEALDIYIKAHELLAQKKFEDLSDVVTEKVYGEMLFNMKTDRVIWKYIKSLDPVRVVHTRVTSLSQDGNAFAQVTVRFHSQQILALYDRFGRMKAGSEILAKDVLEYVVYEKHLSNTYGKWRIHGKIIPPWLPPDAPMKLTYPMPPKVEQEESSLPTETKNLNTEAMATETKTA